jgi:hypothetical protein
MKVIAGVTPDWDWYVVYLDGRRLHNDVIEFDDTQGKVWVKANNADGYTVLTGKVNYRKLVPGALLDYPQMAAYEVYP